MYVTQFLPNLQLVTKSGQFAKVTFGLLERLLATDRIIESRLLSQDATDWISQQREDLLEVIGQRARDRYDKSSTSVLFRVASPT